MKFDPEYCSAMNIRYSRETLAQLGRKGFLVAILTEARTKKVEKQEGSSLEWGVREVLRKMKRVS